MNGWCGTSSHYIRISINISIALLIAIILMIMFPVPVYAIADPDTPPAINAVYVYEDLLDAGDAGVFIDYYLDYAAIPSETVSEAYLVIFIDTDGTTQLQTVAPYTFTDSGYGRGIVWIYFTPAEVTAYGLTSANVALYRVWLTGNPTLGWAGDPPKTIASLDYWQPDGSDPAVLLALRVLYYADLLELDWTLDLIESMTLGNRLTTLGQSYFENVIFDLRTMAPGAFSAGTVDPVYEDIDYTTEFGATMTDGTGTVTGSPITLTEGTTTVTVTALGATGTFILELEQGTIGTVTSNGGTVTGSPVDLVAGTNTITVTVIGTLDVDVELSDTQTGIWDVTVGTAFDLSTVATHFGMSTMMFSGLVWLVITIVICASVYKATDRGEGYAGGGGKITMLIFDVCIVGGAVLGLMSIIVAVLMFIMFGVFTGYILFFRSANV